MILELDDFDQPAIRRQSAQHQSLYRQLLSVGVIELEAVPVSFANLIHSIHLVSERALPEAAEIASQSHGPAFVADALLIEHRARDAYWGDGGDGHGLNRLGALLMRVRGEL